MAREWEKLTWGWFWNGSWVGYTLAENVCRWRDENFFHLALYCLPTTADGDIWANRRKSVGYRQRHVHGPRDCVCVRDGNTCCSSFCKNCSVTTHQPYGTEVEGRFFFFPEEILVSWILCRRDVIITSSVNLVRIIFFLSQLCLSEKWE